MKITTVFLFLLIILNLVSCQVISEIAASDKRFYRRIKHYSHRKDILFVGTDYSSFKPRDTLIINGRLLKKKYVKIIFPGTNTLNFARLYYMNDGSRTGVDSAACQANRFLKLKIDPMNKGEYLIWNTGCHYGRKISLFSNNKPSPGGK